MDDAKVPTPRPNTSPTVARDTVLRAGNRFMGTKYDKSGSRQDGYLKDDKMDCSEFVYQTFTSAGVDFPPLNSHAIAHSKEFEETTTPEKGDIVYWKQGHVAIVTDPEAGEFIGSQSSTGVAKSNYNTNVYWKSRPGRKFFRYKKMAKETP